MPRFALQFPCVEIEALATRYDYGGDAAIGEAIASAAHEFGFVPADTFIRLVAWKTAGRSVPLVERNRRTSIEGATRTALDTTTPERERAEVLVALEGVGYPVASTVLHFGHADPYPILDRRALEAAGYKTQRTVYTFSFWWEWVVFCRRTATACGVSMRTLDRAMWQWSNERGR